MFQLRSYCFLERIREGDEEESEKKFCPELAGLLTEFRGLLLAFHSRFAGPQEMSQHWSSVRAVPGAPAAQTEGAVEGTPGDNMSTRAG